MDLLEFLSALFMWADGYVCSGLSNAAQVAECRGA